MADATRLVGIRSRGFDPETPLDVAIGLRAVLLHAGAAGPPTAAVLPLRVSRGSGRFGKALVGRIAPALGPWPRLRRFEVTLFRCVDYRGSRRSYLSASCPIPLL